MNWKNLITSFNKSKCLDLFGRKGQKREYGVQQGFPAVHYIINNNQDFILQLNAIGNDAIEWIGFVYLNLNQIDL